MIRIGSSFHVPGIRFQSDPSGTVFAADLRRETVWTARTAGRSLPAGAPREDGSAARIQWAAAEKRRAFPARLFISTTVGIAGFGPLSDQTALALEDAASGTLSVEKENLIAAAAGPVLEHGAGALKRSVSPFESPKERSKWERRSSMRSAPGEKFGWPPRARASGAR